MKPSKLEVVAAIATLSVTGPLIAALAVRPFINMDDSIKEVIVSILVFLLAVSFCIGTVIATMWSIATLAEAWEHRKRKS